MSEKSGFVARILVSNLARKFYLSFLIIVAFFSLMNWVVMPWYVNAGGTVTVPDLSGMQLADAQRALDTLGLQPESGGMTSSKLAPNTVLSQNPEAGAVVKHGRRVYLVVSGGALKASVPDLRGHSEREAQFMLERSGFRLGAVSTDTSSDLPQGVVISQSVAPNTSAASGINVSIVVSAGVVGPGQVTVPNLVGRPLSEAQRKILNSNLVLGKITFQPSRKLVPNTVLEQYPRAQEVVGKGTKVDLFVSTVASRQQGPEN